MEGRRKGLWRAEEKVMEGKRRGLWKEEDAYMHGNSCMRFIQYIEQYN